MASFAPRNPIPPVASHLADEEHSLAQGRAGSWLFQALTPTPPCGQVLKLFQLLQFPLSLSGFSQCRVQGGQVGEGGRWGPLPSLYPHLPSREFREFAATPENFPRAFKKEGSVCVWGA